MGNQESGRPASAAAQGDPKALSEPSDLGLTTTITKGEPSAVAHTLDDDIEESVDSDECGGLADDEAENDETSIQQRPPSLDSSHLANSSSNYPGFASNSSGASSNTSFPLSESELPACFDTSVEAAASEARENSVILPVLHALFLAENTNSDHPQIPAGTCKGTLFSQKIGRVDPTLYMPDTVNNSPVSPLDGQSGPTSRLSPTSPRCGFSPSSPDCARSELLATASSSYLESCLNDSTPTSLDDISTQSMSIPLTYESMPTTPSTHLSTFVAASASPAPADFDLDSDYHDSDHSRTSSLHESKIARYSQDTKTDISTTPNDTLRSRILPPIATYAEATNLAARYPEIAAEILVLPLIGQSKPLATIDANTKLAKHSGKTDRQEDAVAYCPDTEDKLAPLRGEAHTPDRPNWALAPDTTPEPAQQATGGAGRGKKRIDNKKRNRGRAKGALGTVEANPAPTDAGTGERRPVSAAARTNQTRRPRADPKHNKVRPRPPDEDEPATAQSGRTADWRISTRDCQNRSPASHTESIDMLFENASAKARQHQPALLPYAPPISRANSLNTTNPVEGPGVPLSASSRVVYRERALQRYPEFGSMVGEERPRLRFELQQDGKSGAWVASSTRAGEERACLVPGLAPSGNRSGVQLHMMTAPKTMSRSVELALSAASLVQERSGAAQPRVPHKVPPSSNWKTAQRLNKEVHEEYDSNLHGYDFVGGGALALPYVADVDRGYRLQASASMGRAQVQPKLFTAHQGQAMSPEEQFHGVLEGMRAMAIEEIGAQQQTRNAAIGRPGHHHEGQGRSPRDNRRLDLGVDLAMAHTRDGRW